MFAGTGIIADGVTTKSTKIPLKNKDGKIIGLVGIFSNITSQKLMYKELKKQNDVIEKERTLLRTLIDNMPDAIYIKNKEK